MDGDTIRIELLRNGTVNEFEWFYDAMRGLNDDLVRWKYEWHPNKRIPEDLKIRIVEMELHSPGYIVFVACSAATAPLSFIIRTLNGLADLGTILQTVWTGLHLDERPNNLYPGYDYELKQDSKYDRQYDRSVERLLKDTEKKIRQATDIDERQQWITQYESISNMRQATWEKRRFTNNVTSLFRAKQNGLIGGSHAKDDVTDKDGGER